MIHSSAVYKFRLFSNSIVCCWCLRLVITLSWQQFTGWTTGGNSRVVREYLGLWIQCKRYLLVCFCFLLVHYCIEFQTVDICLLAWILRRSFSCQHKSSVTGRWTVGLVVRTVSLTIVWEQATYCSNHFPCFSGVCLNWYKIWKWINNHISKSKYQVRRG